MKNSVGLFLFFSIVLATQANAQGCSDAGFCSAGNLQSGSHNTTVYKKYTVGLSCTIGMGEKETFIIIPQLEAQWKVTNKSTLEIKLPYYFANGNLGNNNGVGDVIATLSGQIWKKHKWVLNGIGGLRISTGNANASANGAALPMPYQSNLGTTDLILGASMDYSSFLTIATGWQQPLVQYNDNQYYPDMPNEHSYFASRKLMRKGDVLLRLEGHYKIKRLAVSAGPLLIYHLGNDEITNFSGQTVVLDGSDGLTLNIAGSLAYTAGNFRIDLSAGTPMVVRSNRPDGLTREWVVVPRFLFSF